MECFVPGRVIVGPKTHSVEEHESAIREQIGLPFNFEYSVEDILQRYGLADATKSLTGHFGPLPRVARVQEGTENAASDRLMRTKFFNAACPDFVVRPQPATPVLTVQKAVIDDAIDFVRAAPQGNDCGKQCTIAILDTGIDPAILATPLSLRQLQYDVDDPSDAGKSPLDPYGHGSLIAYIVNCIVPGAEIISIRTMTDTGTVSGVLAGLYLSAALGPCDLINLSLSVSCDFGTCPLCGIQNSTNAAQLRYFFKTFLDHSRATAILAAAGNAPGHLAMPAVFPGVIAVGSFDFQNLVLPAGSIYTHVPTDRYVMAPGGGRNLSQAFGFLPSHRNQTPLFGTSFATAFATGVAARHVCSLKGGPCGPGVKPPPASLSDEIIAAFTHNAERGWPGFDPLKHGIGVLRYART